MKSLHDTIAHGRDFRHINDGDYAESVVHVICLCGHGSFTYNGDRFHLRPNDIAVISAPSNVADIIASEDMECEYLAAPEEYLHSILPANNYSIVGRVSLFANPIIRVTEAEAVTFLDDIHAVINRLGDTSHHYYQPMLSGLLQVMIYDLFDFHVRQYGESTHVIAERAGYFVDGFFSLIKSGMPRTKRQPRQYAHELNVTVKYLSDTVRRATGDSLSTHINRAAVSIIQEFLNDHALSIAQISDEMRFSTPAHFSRYCTKHLGMSPSAYRTLHSGVSR